MIEVFNLYNIENVSTFEEYLINISDELKLNAFVNLILTDDNKLQELNKLYRNLDKPTDVLSFSMNEGMSLQNPASLLGDIYISCDSVLENSKLHQKSFQEELYLVATHGILHLLGYDHAEEDEKKVMFQLQEVLLEKFFK